MTKIKKRFIQRYHQFKEHPVTKGKVLMALCRYIAFNLRIRIFPSITHNWIGDLKFLARKGDAGIIGNIYFGLYEFEESIFLLHFLKENDLFLDIGANVGHYSLLMSGINKCKSIAIEPVPKTYEQLTLQVALNNLSSLIETKNRGVSNKEETLLFSTDRGTMDHIVDKCYKYSVPIKVSTIDNILNERKPMAIKIDVEGYEKFVLEGASRTLQSIDVKVLILELNRSGEIYDVEDKDIYDMITSYGFKTFAYNPIERNLIPLSKYNTHKFNTIFIRDEAFVSNRLKNGNKIKIREKYF